MRERGKHRYLPKHSKLELSPIGECKGGAFNGMFFTANGGLFERPTAAFFTVAAAGVMPRMTVVMVVTTRRKTRFPTDGATSATKAKPPAAATAFCILASPYIILRVVAFAIGLPIFLLW